MRISRAAHPRIQVRLECNGRGSPDRRTKQRMRNAECRAPCFDSWSRQRQLQGEQPLQQVKERSEQRPMLRADPNNAFPENTFQTAMNGRAIIYIVDRSQCPRNALTDLMHGRLAPSRILHDEDFRIDLGTRLNHDVAAALLKNVTHLQHRTPLTLRHYTGGHASRTLERVTAKVRG